LDRDDRLLLGSSFGTAAVAYAEHRPDYAQAAVQWTLERTPGRRVLDLGAGPGTLPDEVVVGQGGVYVLLSAPFTGA